MAFSVHRGTRYEAPSEGVSMRHWTPTTVRSGHTFNGQLWLLATVVVMLATIGCPRPQEDPPEQLCGAGTLAVTQADGTVLCEVAPHDAGPGGVVCGPGTHPETKADGAVLCEPDVQAESCGPEPELSYVCSDNSFPCDCVQGANGAWNWSCRACDTPALDCASTPNDPLCAKDAACINCHGLANGPGTSGIENMHPWSYIACVDCHGGLGRDPANPSRALTQQEAHIAMPVEMRDSADPDQPNRTFYENAYLGSGYIENFEGGLDWIRFRNPSDLRIVQNTCETCHAGMKDKVMKSTMNTLVGKYDAMLQAIGIPRDTNLANLAGHDAFAKHLATVGVVNVTDSEWDRDTSPPGSVPGLVALVTKDRENENPFPNFTERDLYEETINKLCGNCHLMNNGSNDKAGTFRSSGCAACHLPYDYTGRSASGDPLINKQEPSYPAAYDKIEFPERPHPIRHQLTRAPKTQHCFQCHHGSARSVLQYQGIRVDDNRDLTRMQDKGVNIQFQTAKELVDNTLNPQAKLHGHTENQLIKYEDLDEDGDDDTPPDAHWEAGFDCIDCHNSSEMHGDGKIYSRQSSATKIYCTHCHGTVEHEAEPDNPENPINELYFATNRPSRKVLWRFDTAPIYGDQGYPYVTQPGIWMRSKSKNQWHFVSQIKWGVKWDPNAQDCFAEGRRIDPRSGGQSCTPASSIAHGRWNGLTAAQGDFDDGVGPRPNNEVVSAGDGTATPREGFSHLGGTTTSGAEVPAGGLQCTACHAEWQAMRYGNHLGLVDTDGTERFYEWDRVTGKTTLGKQQHFNFTYVSNQDVQLAINSKGRIAWFLPARLKIFVRQTVMDGNDQPFEFMTQVGDSNHIWKSYRDRVGLGNLLYNQGDVNNAPGWPSTCLENQGYCDSNPNKNVNPGLGMDQMEPHTVRRRPRDCLACHLDANSSNNNLVSAVYGWNPNGYNATTSSYLNKVSDIATGDGRTYDTSDGYVIADDGIQHRLDWLVDENTGYPLVYNLHVRTDDGKEGRPKRGYETYNGATAGPVTKELIDKLKRIKVINVYDE